MTKARQKRRTKVLIGTVSVIVILLLIFFIKSLKNDRAIHSLSISTPAPEAPIGNGSVPPRMPVTAEETQRKMVDLEFSGEGIPVPQTTVPLGGGRPDHYDGDSDEEHEIFMKGINERFFPDSAFREEFTEYHKMNDDSDENEAQKSTIENEYDGWQRRRKPYQRKR